MTPERHEQIERLFHAAAEVEPQRRPSFLDDACQGDAALRAEVESLLASHDGAEGFIVDPALEVAAKALGRSLAPSMTGRRFDHYEILSLLGAGGMGEVYLARDTQLDRTVAIKFLRPDPIGDVRSRQSLIREARAAARLNHPNICAIHQVVDEPNGSFIVMQYVEGETLASHIARARIPVDRALDIAAQAASALAEAHMHGIVHGDIKPQNIMITAAGRVQVLDFGLARTIADPNLPSDEMAGNNSLAQSGVIIGTIAYMSPEQLRGDPVDARTDVFSIGIVIYEMLAGRRPFDARAQTETIAAILTQQPPSLRQFAPKVPQNLSAIVNKALKKKREERYANGDELLKDLQTRAATPRRKISVVAAILVLAAIVLASYSIPRAGRKPIDSLAVMPFTNVAGDLENDFLADGISDSLINNLSEASNLKVVSFSSVLRFKGQTADPQDVGHQLKVNAVLTGRLYQHGDTLTINTELVDVNDSHRIWGQQYNRKPSDILAVQHEIAQEIAQQLKLTLSISDRQQLSKVYTKNAAAYRLYLQGHYYWSKFTVDGVRKSIPYYEQAIDKDPDYALAYSALADSYIVLGTSVAPPTEVFPKAKAAITKGLALDESLAAAHISLGAYKLFYEWDWPGAEKEAERARELNPSYKKAIELNTNYGDTNHYYCQYLDVMGRSDEAIGEMRRALEFDPLAFVLYGEIGFSHYIARRYQQAIDSAQKGLESNPNLVMAYQAAGDAYEQLGRMPEAITELTKARAISKEDPWIEADLGNAYAVAGRKTEARQLLNDLIDRRTREYISPYFVALIYAGLRDKEQSLTWLNKAYNDRSALMTWLKVDPKLDGLRSDPRFTDLLRRVGFTP